MAPELTRGVDFGMSDDDSDGEDFDEYEALGSDRNGLEELETVRKPTGKKSKEWQGLRHER